jgi:hypothetical protein
VNDSSPYPPMAGSVEPANPLPAGYAGLKSPRPKSPPQRTGCFNLGFGIVWCLFSLAFLGIAIGFGLNSLNTYRLLRDEGRTVEGTVVRLEIDDSDDSTDYIVYYHYQAAIEDDLRSYEDHQSVDDTYYYQLREGQPVEVLYAASQPDVSQLKAVFQPPDLLAGLLFGVFILLFEGFGVVMVLGPLRRIRQAQALERDGQLSDAIVFNRWQDEDSDGDPTYAVAYAFKAPTPDGMLKMVTAAEFNREAYQATQVGDTIRVRYLPEKPEVNRIQGFPHATIPSK